MNRVIEALESRTLFAAYSASTVTQLVAAINKANASVGADTITLAADATFILTASSDTTHGDTGLPRITDGGGLTIVGSGATLDRSTADVGCRFFDVAPGGALTLNNLTIQNGAAYSPLAGDGTFTFLPARGGAIFNEGSLSLNSVTIQHCAAQAAGGGFYGTSTATDAAGGGIYSTGMLALDGCTIRNNVAAGGYGQDAGFIYADMGGIYYPSSDGGDGIGGGVCIAAGSASLTNSTFTSNAAMAGAGGSGYSYGPNVAGSDGGDGLGGGLYVNGTVSVRNSTATLNTARGGIAGRAGGSGSKRNTGTAGRGIGGGIYRAGGSLALDDFTLAHVVDNIASTSSSNIGGSTKRLH
jgi:hypothetical protein